MSRRGFLNGAGLAAMGTAVGGSIPFSANLPTGLLPAALAQGFGNGVQQVIANLNHPGTDG